MTHILSFWKEQLPKCFNASTKCVMFEEQKRTILHSAHICVKHIDVKHSAVFYTNTQMPNNAFTPRDNLFHNFVPQMTMCN